MAGVGKFVQWKSHLQKTKNTSELQNKFIVSVNTRVENNTSYS